MDAGHDFLQVGLTAFLRAAETKRCPTFTCDKQQKVGSWCREKFVSPGRGLS